jgi:ubiquinone/menaquinone biosynthesis C-methylase UbiE
MNPGYSRHLRMSAARLRLGPNASILDLCCGTGLSTEALVSVYPEAAITGLDASEGMLERARQKSWPAHVRFVHGDAMHPAASAGVEPPFDGILMAYGIRNVPDADACLARLRELLVPGGVICFHEFSVADSRLRTMVWNAVSYGVIIPGGLVMGGSSKIYRYLRKSVVDFDGVAGFETRLKRAGFIDVVTEPTDGWQRGIVHSFIARRPH